MKSTVRKPRRRADARRADMRVIPGSGNIFVDVGFDAAEARVMALLKGAWKDFSMDMLLTLATRAGRKPELRLLA